MKKGLLFTCFILMAYSSVAQLSDLHYLPPLKQESSPNYAIFDHKIYLTTPNTTSFVVDVYRGTSSKIIISIRKIYRVCFIDIQISISCYCV